MTTTRAILKAAVRRLENAGVRVISGYEKQLDTTRAFIAFAPKASWPPISPILPLSADSLFGTVPIPEEYARKAMQRILGGSHGPKRLFPEVVGAGRDSDGKVNVEIALRRPLKLKDVRISVDNKALAGLPSATVVGSAVRNLSASSGTSAGQLAGGASPGDAVRRFGVLNGGIRLDPEFQRHQFGTSFSRHSQNAFSAMGFTEARTHATGKIGPSLWLREDYVLDPSPRAVFRNREYVAEGIEHVLHQKNVSAERVEILEEVRSQMLDPNSPMPSLEELVDSLGHEAKDVFAKRGLLLFKEI